ncbi:MULTISPECIES: hypothetical protein [Oceanobacillus]|uniref:hypothetical protein n=1 Tax=Oceanobacillus TaxID=182709 RepID=UPI0006220E1B|nr:hypothetical protein WH51_06490 [Bacilli bacterium VT-13-104]
METITPKKLLGDLSKRNKASEQDLKIVREVMISQSLPSPVMNVLIHYVLLQTTIKLFHKGLLKILGRNKSYIGTIEK